MEKALIIAKLSFAGKLLIRKLRCSANGLTFPEASLAFINQADKSSHTRVKEGTWFSFLSVAHFYLRYLSRGENRVGDRCGVDSPFFLKFHPIEFYFCF